MRRGGWYRHTQIGWAILAALLGSALVLLSIATATGRPSVLVPVAVVLAVGGILFATLTVEVDERDVVLSFGPGLLRRRLPLNQVLAIRRVRNPWYTGWGIHVIGGGTVYNVSGLHAVELTFQDGRRVRIGTDEPLPLEAAIRQGLGPAPDPASPEVGPPRPPGKSWMFLGVPVLLAAVGAVTFAQARRLTVTAAPDALVVENPFYGERYAWCDVRDVTLESRVPRVRLRLNGYAMGATLRGKFLLEALGDGKLFLNLEKPPFILVRTGRGFVMLGMPDPARTRELYRRIEERRRAAAAGCTR